MPPGFPTIYPYIGQHINAVEPEKDSLIRANRFIEPKPLSIPADTGFHIMFPRNRFFLSAVKIPVEIKTFCNLKPRTLWCLKEDTICQEIVIMYVHKSQHCLEEAGLSVGLGIGCRVLRQQNTEPC